MSFDYSENASRLAWVSGVNDWHLYWRDDVVSPATRRFRETIVNAGLAHDKAASVEKALAPFNDALAKIRQDIVDAEKRQTGPVVAAEAQLAQWRTREEQPLRSLEVQLRQKETELLREEAGIRTGDTSGRVGRATVYSSKQRQYDSLKARYEDLKAKFEREFAERTAEVNRLRSANVTPAERGILVGRQIDAEHAIRERRRMLEQEAPGVVNRLDVLHRVVWENGQAWPLYLLVVLLEFMPFLLKLMHGKDEYALIMRRVRGDRLEYAQSGEIKYEAEKRSIRPLNAQSNLRHLHQGNH